MLSLDKSSDGSLLISGSKDHQAMVWSIENGNDTENPELNNVKVKCVGVCTGHNESVGAIAMAKRGRNFMVTGSQDRTVKVWSIPANSKYYFRRKKKY